MIKLFTEKLIIRDLVFEDLENHHKLCSNDNVMRYTLKMKPNNIEEANSINRQIYSLMIEDRATHEFIGEIGYRVTQNTPYGKLVIMGFFIMEKHWNKGYVTEALKHLLNYMFEKNNVYRISVGCIKENIGAIKVLEKCRFQKEGEYGEYCFHENLLKDWVEYGLLKRDGKICPHFV